MPYFTSNREGPEQRLAADGLPVRTGRPWHHRTRRDGSPARPPSAAGGASELLAQLPEQSGDAGAAPWLTVLGRAVARGEASPEALHPRVATVAMVLLRNEFVVRGVPTAPDDVLVEIVDEVYLPLVRRRGPATPD